VLSLPSIAAVPEPQIALADPVADLRAAIEDAFAELRGAGGGEAGPTVERPPKPELGDYSTNAAMLLAPVLGEPPRQFAEKLRERLAHRLGAEAERVEVAGPGFLNVFLAGPWYRRAVGSVLAAGEGFGAAEPRSGESVIVEFVSANPTGPLNVASGRAAAYGDSLARMLECAGHEVQREYYLNDMGGQIERFAASIAARMSGSEPPDDGYEGEYVAELAEQLRQTGANPADLDELARLGTEAMRERIEASLARFRVGFDRWVSERSLYESGDLETIIGALRERGHVYEREGALWLRTTEFGDDKDRVLVRSGGKPTYFAPDIAYHRDKLERAERLITPVGADHHGYVPRMRAAIAALGADPDRFEAPIIQLVHVVEGAERARMSKRKGDFVTLDELVDDIGVDAARFFMVQRSHDRTLDLDLELARRQSSENPVYYVQYAHARIASILRKAGPESRERALAAGAAADGGLEAAPIEADSERALIKRLLELPGEVRAAAELRAPHRLCAYGIATAADFHAFYRDCQVIGAGPGLEEARLGLCVATKRVIARTLGLLGVSAPERM
jgi:arginyl-tRNA synthetase